MPEWERLPKLLGVDRPFYPTEPGLGEFVLHARILLLLDAVVGPVRCRCQASLRWRSATARPAAPAGHDFGTERGLAGVKPPFWTLNPVFRGFAPAKPPFWILNPVFRGFGPPKPRLLVLYRDSGGHWLQWMAPHRAGYPARSCWSSWCMNAAARPRIAGTPRRPAWRHRSPDLSPPDPPTRSSVAPGHGIAH